MQHLKSFKSKVNQRTFMLNNKKDEKEKFLMIDGPYTYCNSFQSLNIIFKDDNHLKNYTQIIENDIKLYK